MGLANLTFGLFGALCLMTVPQRLAAAGVSQLFISSITAFALIPTFAGFLFAPILDVRFDRRTYAVVFGMATACLGVVALTHLDRLEWLAPLLFLGFLSANLYYNALGGWLGSVVPHEQAGRLAAGFTAGNVAGFGIGAILFILFLHHLPGLPGALACGALILVPLLLLPFIPTAPVERRGAKESFHTLGRDLLALLRSRVVLRTLFLFCLPASSFALTNTLGGLGARFGASETFVAAMAGLGVTAAGIVGTLFVPALVKRIEPLILYLAIGTLGACFTLSLIGLPRTPMTFALALFGQNIFQAVAFAVESTIVFRTIGQDNPLAATQFAFLQAATCLPISYMQAVDGQAFDRGGLDLMLATDAAASLAACAVIALATLLWVRHRRRQAITPLTEGGLA
ncbi:MFS transporter [Sphingomonas fuzhouensis]|uniref:MFS transporter n=1 Tax=Sphingomonas fuzhouensis TaxID=3106033 RepID=UPI002AFEEC8D|nr:MFS transporter [Sphingomonas sp. SGZ-02]